MKPILIRIGWALPGLALLLLIWGAITHFAGGMAGLFAPENALRSLQEMLAQGSWCAILPSACRGWRLAWGWR